MPKTWTKKDERQYEKIKQSESTSGRTKLAREIAARTVNKRRRQERRTKTSSRSVE